MAKDCPFQKMKIFEVSKFEKNKSFIAVFSPTINPDLWYLDSGATMHVSNKSDWMYDITSSPLSTITVASNPPLPVDYGKCKFINKW